MSSHAANALFDSACELLYAAQELRRAAQEDGAEEALAAVLGCIGATIEELAEVSDDLSRQVLRSRYLADPGATTTTQALDILTQSLQAADRSCASARTAASTLRDRRRRLAHATEWQ